jgi:hypothetical protein
LHANVPFQRLSVAFSRQVAKLGEARTCSACTKEIGAEDFGAYGPFGADGLLCPIQTGDGRHVIVRALFDGSNKTESVALAADSRVCRRDGSPVGH